MANKKIYDLPAGTPTLSAIIEGQASDASGAASEKYLLAAIQTVFLLNAPLTGTPVAPTAVFGTNTTQVATTAFVQAALAGVGAPASAEYIVGALNGSLSAERLASTSTSITVNLGVGGQVTWERAALTGDVTASANSNAMTIAPDVVTFAKLQNISTDRLIGRDTAGSGDPEEITVGGGLEFTGSSGIQIGAFTGDVTKSAGSTALAIANNAVVTVKIADANVTFAKIQNIATDRLIGRDTASSGAPEEISLATGLEFTGSASIQVSAFTGDIAKAAGSNATTVATINALSTAAEVNRMCDVSTRRVLVGGTSLGLTEASHSDKQVLLDHTAATSTVTLPAASGSGARFQLRVHSVNTNSHIVKVANSSDTMSGSVNLLDNDSNAQTAYAASGTDDTLTLNGTTTGGQVGDWVEFFDLKANVWAVRGQLVCPAGSNVADPFSATV